MRSRWIRAMAVLLTVSLLLGDGSWGLEFSSYATESSNLENEIKSENEDSSTDDANDTSDEDGGNDTSDDDEDGGDDASDEDNGEDGGDDASDEDNGEDGGDDTSDEDNGEDGGDDASDEDNGEDGGDDTSDEDNGEDGGDDASDEDNGEDGGDDTSDGGEDEDDTADAGENGDNEETGVDENGDVLPDEAIGAPEEEIIEAVSMFGLERGAEGSTDNRVELPEDVDEYEKYEVSNKVYVFSKPEDYLRLQEQCKKSDFEGVVFKIGNTGTDTLEINEDFFKDVEDFDDFDGFEGFGSEDYPFKGSMTMDYSADSFHIALEQPLFNYVGSGAEFYDFSLEGKKGTQTAIAKNIVFEDDETEPVLIHDLIISGVIDKEAAAGTIAGTISSNAVIELRNITSEVETISGTTAGGIAGSIGSNVTITAEDVVLSGKIKGTEAAGGFYGTINGSHTWDVSENNLDSDLSVEASKGGYAGAFAGKLCKGEGDSILTIENDSDITITANVSGAGNSGGLLGVCEKDTVLKIEQALTVDGEVAGATAGGLLGEVNEAVTVKLDKYICSAEVSGSANAGGVFGSITEDADKFIPELFSGSSDDSDADRPEFLVTGTIDATDGYAGAYAGTIRADVIVPKITTQSSTEISAYKGAGGVVGRLTGQSRTIIEGASIGQENGNEDGGNIKAEYAGGIIGVIDDASAVELQDTFVLHATLSDGTIGSVAGKADECLVYLSEPVETGKRTSQLAFDNATEAWAEIGSYGGVFRNQDIGGDEVLIGNGTLEKVGEVASDYVTRAGSAYTLKGTNGLVCLAIALQTQGNYGMAPFGYTDGASDDEMKALLAADYTLDGNADISYDTTGVITINRNDKENDGDGPHTFRGSLSGKEEETTIVQNSRTYSDGVVPKVYQSRTGLFSTIEGDNTFKNLSIQGTVQYEKGTGGIAYRAIGNSLTLENIEMHKKFRNLDAGDAIGGIAAKEEGGTDPFEIKAKNVILASEIYAGENTEFAGFIVNADKINLALDDITLGGVLRSEKNSDSPIGGFLGKEWKDVTGYVNEIKVESGTTFYAGGYFGGLVYVLNSRKGEYITMQDIDLNNLTVEIGNIPSKTNSFMGLLVYDGRALALNIVDYSCKGCTIKNAPQKFDEVVGNTTSRGDNMGGIISLHSTTEKFPKYHYEEQATYIDRGTYEPGANATGMTRYFYDVYQTLEKGGMDTVLDSPEEVLLWSVYYNAREGAVRSVFENENLLNSNKTYTFKGNIDLSGVSVYPVPNADGMTLAGTDNAKLIFDASNMDNHADTTDDAPDKLHANNGSWSIPNNSNRTVNNQHYGLHSGLLLNASGITASDFTLSGTVANRGTESGALVAGTLSGGGSFQNITLDDLWIANYTGGEDYGLLISNIVADNSGTKQNNTVDVTFGSTAANGTITKGIVMTGYDEVATDKKAAAALIGSVGSADMTNLKLDFRNMKVADGKAASNSHNGTIFAKASYICTYQHTSNADAYTGRCWYLFTKEEAGEMITYGSEIDGDTEYWWEEIGEPDPHTNVIDTIKKEDGNFNPANYLPYVYRTELIEVNPKPGDINKGCGTYEDPYIISDRKQFLTLYRYLNMMKENSTDAADTEFFKNWKVNAFGSDAEICAKVHGDDDLKTFGTAGFPTQAQMRRAYYRLGEDIDMSGMTGGNYKAIADNFVGFGTKEYPFTGVWYGKDEDGNIHTVTLPSKSASRTYDSFGFLQYAKGAVVKDMNIKSAAPTNGETKNDIITRITGRFGMGGSVIGCVLGGDNIIDNVSVDTEFMVLRFESTNEMMQAAVGGYVGCVKKGGLILRNTELADVNQFVVYDAYLREVSTMAKQEYHRYIGAFVGRVEDGYVLHEDRASDGSAPIWQSGKTGGKGGYAIAPDYEILDGDYLESKTIGDGGIVIGAPDESGNVKNITAKLPNAAALQVLSMAINSDALNTCSEPNSEQGNKTYGYTGYSRSRKAQYSDIGCGSTASDDRTAAVKYDNINSCPYLYKYLNIEPSEASVYIKDGMAVLNAAEKVDNAAYHTTWKLTGNDVYDMGIFGKGFRGIGALYDLEDGYGGTFRGSFDGGFDDGDDSTNATVKLDMKSIAWSVYQTSAYYDLARSPLRCMGLFNTLVGVKAKDWYKEEGNETIIQNLTVTGAVQVANDVPAGQENSSLPIDAGGVAGRIEGMKTTLSNVTAKDLTLNAGTKNTSYYAYSPNRKAGCFGGLVANITGNEQVTIKDCAAKNTDKPTKATMKGSCFGGGLVGSIGSENNSIPTTAEVKIIATKDSIVAENLYIETINENAGGLVGYGQYGSLHVNDEPNGSPELQVKNCTVVGYWHAGGCIGETAIPLKLARVSVTGADVKAYKVAGGIVGGASDAGKTSKLESVKVYDSKIQEREINTNAPYTNEAGHGGILGKNAQTMTILDAEVGVTSDTEIGIVESVDNSRIYNGGERPNGVGGIVGYHKNNTLTLGDCSVKGITVKADKDAGYINKDFEAVVCAGGIVGYGDAPIKLTGDIKTEDLNVSSVEPDSYEYGKYLSAGGCFGLIKKVMSTDTTDKYYSGISAKNNNVYGKEAGGIFGVTLDEVWLSEPEVSGGTIRGVESAGGIVGSCKEGSGANFSLNKPASTEAEAAANPKATVDKVEITGKYVGGAIGSVMMSGPMRLENLKISNCKLVGETMTEASGGNGIGGVIGFYRIYQDNHSAKLYYIELEKNTIVYESEKDELNDGEKESISAGSNYVAVGGILGRICNENDQLSGYIYADNIILHPDNVIGIRKTGSDENDTEAVKLITEDNKLADVELPKLPDSIGMTMRDAAAELAENYGYYVGTLIGVNNEENIYTYMMRIRGSADDDTPPVLAQKNAPTTDVGRLPGVQTEAYRNRTHIIYGTRNSGEDDGRPNVEYMDSMVEAAFEEYTGSESLQEICQIYRMQDELEVQTTSGDSTDAGAAVTKAVDELWEEAYSLTKADDVSGQKLPILVCKPGVITLDQQIKLFADIMTNVSGISSTKVGILSITQRNVEWNLISDAKTKTSLNEASSHISITRTADDDYAFTYNGTENFDSYDYENGVLNYTELIFKYTCPGEGNHVRTLVLPVFVEEPLILDVQTKMLAGRVNSVAEMADGISDIATIANDSDYTLLLDFSYGNAREGYDRTMEKQIYLTSDRGIKQFEEGTRLLLIDVTNGNKPYYYTVTSDSPDKIPLSAFTDTGEAPDTQGTTAYIEQNINRNKNTDGTTYDGHDRYILQVLPGVKGENSIYDIHIGFKDVDDTNKRTFGMEGTTEAVIRADAIPGLTFQLLKAGAGNNLVEPLQGTLVKGELREGSVLTVDMEYYIKMDPLYSAKENPMDSANNDKYLDLACYLSDENGKRIPLPEGTNIRYKDADGETVTERLTDYVSIYYYKDVAEKEYLIRGDGGITETVQVPLQIEILLPEDISVLTEDTYTVHIDLLRTDDPTHPAGYEDALDTYQYHIGADAIPKLGFAVTVEESDWDKLGINTYRYDEEFPRVEEDGTQIHEIPFKVQVDFRNILRQVSGDAIEEEWAGKDYYITYRLFGKGTDGSYPSEVFTDDDVSPETLRVAAKEDTPDDGAASEEAYEIGSDGSLRMKYQFTQDEIHANADTLLEKGTPIEREGKVILNMDQLKGISSKEELEKYLTNYKMEAVLQITDMGVDPSETETNDVSDFFIFNVTRLKTDIE